MNGDTAASLCASLSAVSRSRYPVLPQPPSRVCLRCLRCLDRTASDAASPRSLLPSAFTSLSLYSYRLLPFVHYMSLAWCECLEQSGRDPTVCARGASRLFPLLASPRGCHPLASHRTLGSPDCFASRHCPSVSIHLHVCSILVSLVLRSRCRYRLVSPGWRRLQACAVAFVAVAARRLAVPCCRIMCVCLPNGRGTHRRDGGVVSPAFERAVVGACGLATGRPVAAVSHCVRARPS